MAKRTIALLSLCIIVAVCPFCASALRDLKLPLREASYCRALGYCSEHVPVRASGQWLDCITAHALRDPPSENPGSSQNSQPPAVVLMDCGGVGWGNRFRAFHVRRMRAYILS